jgi:hypothetical protein
MAGRNAAPSAPGPGDQSPVEISIRFRQLDGSAESSLSSGFTLAGALQVAHRDASSSPGPAAWVYSSTPGQGAPSGAAGLPASLPASLTQLMAMARGVAPGTAGASDASARSTADPTSAAARMQRLSSMVAGSIFSDLVNGALRPGDMGPPPASERAIKDLPTCSPSDDSQCSVCISGIDEGCTQMPCGHQFHRGCLTKWLRSHNTCPVCRATVEADETPRSSLSSLINSWRETHMRAEASQGGPAVPGALGSGGSGGAAAESPRAPISEPELLRLSISELKMRLRELGVDTSTVVEKRELQDLLRQHSRAPTNRLRVQVHMEVLQLPPGLATGPGPISGRSIVEALQQQASNAAAELRAATADAAAAEASRTTATTADSPAAQVRARRTTLPTRATRAAAGTSTDGGRARASPGAEASPLDGSAAARASASRRRPRDSTPAAERETRKRTRK